MLYNLRTVHEVSLSTRSWTRPLYVEIPRKGMFIVSYALLRQMKKAKNNVDDDGTISFDAIHHVLLHFRCFIFYYISDVSRKNCEGERNIF